jgi:hypothetical protein
MKKVIRLTESDLARIVKRVLMEEEGFTMQGMKLVDISFPEYGLMGKRPDPNADVPKTLVGAVTTTKDWISKGQVKLSNGKKELIILGKEKLGSKILPDYQLGQIQGATEACKGITSGEKIPAGCTVFILMNNKDEYECKSTGCTPR